MAIEKPTSRENLQKDVKALADELEQKPPLDQVAAFKETFQKGNPVKIRDYADGTRLQMLLFTIGFDPKGVDSWVGSKTKAALKAFKKIYNEVIKQPPIAVNDSFDGSTLEAFELYCKNLPKKNKEGFENYYVENAAPGSYIRFKVHGEDEAQKPVLRDSERSRREIEQTKKLLQQLRSGYSVTINPEPTEELDDEDVRDDKKRSRQEIAAATKRQKELASGQSVTIDAEPLEEDSEEAEWPEYTPPDTTTDSQLKYQLLDEKNRNEDE